MNDLWENLAKRKVLVAPGFMFSGTGQREGLPDDPSAPPKANAIGEDSYAGPVQDLTDGIGHFRMAFSFSTHEVMREGIKIFAETVTEYFEE